MLYLIRHVETLINMWPFKQFYSFFSHNSNPNFKTNNYVVTSLYYSWVQSVENGVSLSQSLKSLSPSSLYIREKRKRKRKRVSAFEGKKNESNKIKTDLQYFPWIYVKINVRTNNSIFLT